MSKNKLDALLTPTVSKTPEDWSVVLDKRQPKILTLDIETSPNVSYTWGLWNQNVGISQIIESTRMISFAAKWHHQKKTFFYSEHHNSRKEMIQAAWDLLNEADILVTYNGINFDVKHLQREFVSIGMTPPSPFKNVDLLRVIKGQFRFPSNKLDYVSQAIGIGQKVKHEGQELWNLVLSGDEKAWGRMKRYNIQDVKLTESLFDFLGPWIKSPHIPHMGLWMGERTCYRCGSDNLVQDGFGHTNATVYARLQCHDCGGWNRLNVVKGRTETKPLR